MTQPLRSCPYLDPFDISIWNYLEQGTPIIWETDELVIRAVEMADKFFFRALFIDPEVMKNFTDHEARYLQMTPAQWEHQQIEAADQRLAQLVRRWVEEKDPFSGFVIIDKETGQMRAHVTAGHANPRTPGTAEIALMIPKEKWNKRYGTISIRFILNYLVALSRIYDRWSGCPLTIDGAQFSEIIAMVRVENRYSLRIAEKRMTRCPGEIEKWNIRMVLYKFPVLTAKL